MRKIKTRFGPETNFEVPAAAGRAVQTTELEQLKERLLRPLLAPVAEAEQNNRLRQAANDAAALAWATNYPLLFFPGLLEELTKTALRQGWRQQEARRRGLGRFPEVVCAG